MGRAGWFDEVMRFYDRFLKGVEPKVKDPLIAVQTNDGKWRAETAWPPADASGYTTDLLPGTLHRRRQGLGSPTPTACGRSRRRCPTTCTSPGSGRATVDVSSALPRSNLVVDVYDLDANGTGPLITRQGHMIYASGEVPLDLWSADWKIPAGHRIGVRVTDANSDWWVHVPTLRTYRPRRLGHAPVPAARRATQTIQGDPGTQLEGYLAETVTVPPETIS